MSQRANTIVDISADVTLSDLEAVEAQEARNERRPKTLPLSAIRVADQVFQWRLPGQNMLASHEHIRELMRALRAQEQPLDPVLVTAVGGAYYLVDGHHRITAYQSLGWRESIPVTYFEGSLHEAIQEALKRNVKSQLPLTREAKFEAAWSLARQGHLSANQIRTLTTVSRRTIVSMRGKARELGKKAECLTWAEARRGNWEPIPDNNWRQAKAQKVADTILRNTGISLERDPRILADALPLVHDNLPDYLILEWGHRVPALMAKYPERFEVYSADDLDI